MATPQPEPAPPAPAPVVEVPRETLMLIRRQAKGALVAVERLLGMPHEGGAN